MTLSHRYSSYRFWRCWVKCWREPRQGNPLSLLLFILVLEVLSRMLKGTEAGSFISGFRVRNGENSLLVSHVPFADDTILFCDATMKQLLHIRMMLTWFEDVTGLKMNLSKSEIETGGEVGDIDEGWRHWCFGEHFCCMIGGLPLNYSSMHLRSPFKARVARNTILEEMKHRLSSWKHCICQKGEYAFQFTNLLPLYFISFV